MIHRLGPPEPVGPPPSDRPPLGTVGYVPPMVIDNKRKPDPLEYWPNLIMRLALAFGFAALILAVFFALIYSFLRWVLA